MADSGVILDPALVFEQLLSSNPAVVAAHPPFVLPASIRRQIYGFCFPVETRKISLSPRFATKAVWTNGHFASPWDILEDVMGGLGSCKALRRDLMTYFWAEYHFHVTLTPFNGPKFSPLSHVWMQDHLGLVQRLTVEADLTRFGGSQLVDAQKFGYNVEKIEGILADIVKGISMRAHWIPMAEFNLMCRRFEGSRPLRVAAAERHSTISKPSSTSSKDVPYVPDESMFLCDVISNLRGIVQSTQISGFTRQYSHMLLSALFADGDEELYYKAPDSTPWPLFLPGSVIIPTPKDVSKFEFGLQSNDTQALATGGHNKKQSTGTVVDNATIDEPLDVNNEITNVRRSTTASSISTVLPGDDPLSEKDAQSIADRPTSFKLPDGTDEGISANRLSNSSVPQSNSECVQPSCPATPKPTCQPSNESIPQPQAKEIPSDHPATPEQAKSIPSTTKPIGISNQLSSPNAMNKMNEQDPAFRRALEGLRLVDQQSKGPVDITRPKSALSLATLRGRPEQIDRVPHRLTKPRPAVASTKQPYLLGKIKDIFFQIA